MNIKEILNTVEHRPWPIPNQDWKFYQEWNRLIFLHWQVDLDELQKHVPEKLEIDLFDGKPWVSLVAFTMEQTRPRNLPAVKFISDFDEINIRTYVKCNNKTGVYFLSIEAGKSLSCKTARVVSGLPYRFSKMNRIGGCYKSENSQRGDSFEVDYTIGKEARQKSPLDVWLTERYAVFDYHHPSMIEFEVLHPEWPIQQVEIHNLKTHYPRFEKLIAGVPDLAHYSKGVQVLAWGKSVI